MKLAVIGVGNAGSRVANRILAVERASGRNLCGENNLLVNTAPPSFDAPEMVPEERRLIIGDVHRNVNGKGTDKDPDLGAEVAQDDTNEFLRAVDAIEFYQIDGVLVVAGLGGGTGGGAGSVIIDELKNICDEPIYALGILPSKDEGSRAALTAARSLRSFVERADNVIVFDNDAWRDQERTSEGEYVTAADGRYDQVNLELATRMVTLFAAGELRGETVAENLMDPSDLMRTLDTGGVSAIGFAGTEVEPQRTGFMGWLRGIPLLGGLFAPSEPAFAEVIDKDDWDDDVGVEGGDGDGETEDEDETSAARIEKLVRRAVRSKLTLPCEVSSADRALILLSGPSHELSRKGFESGRYWLEQEADTVEVMAGDEPHDTTNLTATVLLSNVTDVPRIEELQDQAVPAIENLESDDEDDIEWVEEAEH